MYLPKQRPVAVKKLKFHEKLTSADIQVCGKVGRFSSEGLSSEKQRTGRGWKVLRLAGQGRALGRANVTGEVAQEWECGALNVYR